MAFTDRIVEHPGRYQLINADTDEVLGTFDLVRAEGTVTEEGTPLNATNLNAEMASIAQNEVADLSGAIAVSAAGNVHFKNLQAGSKSVSHTGTGTRITTHITFSQAFSTPPMVVVSVNTGYPGNVFAATSGTTTTGFDLVTYHVSAGTVGVRWIAFV